MFTRKALLGEGSRRLGPTNHSLSCTLTSLDQLPTSAMAAAGPAVLGSIGTLLAVLYIRSQARCFSHRFGVQIPAWTAVGT